jgi:hypothetical protein
MKQIGRKVADATRADVKGLPLSDWDIKNIGYLINFYERAYPGYITHFIEQARQEVEPIVKQQTVKKGFSDLNMTKRMAIPQDLLLQIKRGYPAIIVDPVQFNQFLKAYPIFDLHRK